MVKYFPKDDPKNKKTNKAATQKIRSFYRLTREKQNQKCNN